MLLIFFYFCVRDIINYYEIYWIFCWCHLFCPFFNVFQNLTTLSSPFILIHILESIFLKARNPTNAVKYEIIPLIYQEKSRSTSFLTIAWKKNFLKGCQTLPLTLVIWESDVYLSHKHLMFGTSKAGNSITCV